MEVCSGRDRPAVVDRSRPSSATQLGHVSGMNCTMPWAPTAETTVGFQVDSVWIWAAITAGVIGGQSAPALATHGGARARGPRLV
jgi:hypothetical protein